MNERQTTTFITPGGNTVVLNAYLTGDEGRDLKHILIRALNLNMSDAENRKVDMGIIPGTVLADQEKKLIELVVVSINGDTDNPVAKLLALPSTEYEAVLKEAEKIKNPTSQESTAQPGSDTTQTA
jgi:hypothetical protein